MYAFRAYKSHTFLEMAENMWKQQKQLQVTSQDVRNGTHVKSNVKIAQKCGHGSCALFL